MRRARVKKVFLALCLIMLLASALYYVVSESEKPFQSASAGRLESIDKHDVKKQAVLSAAALDKSSIAVPFSQVFASAPVNDLLIDPSGVVWAATEAGITSVSADEVKHYSFAEGTFPYLQAQCLAHDGKTLWVGTLFGLARLTKGERFVSDDLNEQLKSKLIWSLMYDNSALWVGTQSGLVLKPFNSDAVFINAENTHGALRDNHCRRIKKIDGKIAVVHNKGISFCGSARNGANPNWWRSLDIYELGLVKPILSIGFDKKNIWLATPAALVKLSSSADKIFSSAFSGCKSYTTLHGLPSNRINDVAFNKGSLWVAASKGLARVRGERIQTIVSTTETNAGPVRCICAAGDLLWLGTDNGIQFINTAMID